MEYGYTKLGACQIVKDEGATVVIQLANRKRTMTVSRTQLLPAPKQMRLARKANFDQKCGCTPIINVEGTKVECFNVYGKVAKFCESKEQSDLDLTPHLSRKFLKEHGFRRASGQKPRTVKDVAEFLFHKEKEGYTTLEAKAPRTRKPKTVSTPLVAEAATV